MALPETIRVKLSSEAAEAISLTPVVVRDIPVRELAEHMLAAAGKDEARVREILQRGALVSGGSRFRWTGCEAAIEEVRALLGTFPDPDPTRPFARDRAIHATLRSARGPIAIPRAAAERKGVFQRATFWGVLLDLAAPTLAYAGYSYRDRADRYAGALAGETLERLREASALLRYTTLREHIRISAIHAVEVLVER